MSPIRLLPLASALIIVAFVWLVFRRYASRGGRHLLVWGVGLLLFGTASLAEAVSASVWHPMVFRLWYFTGAVLSAAWIGQGTVYLLAGVRLPNVLLSLVLGYAAAASLFLLLARLGLGAAIAGVLIAFHGVIFAGMFHRLLVRRWDPLRLTGVLTGLLLAGSLLAAAVIIATPVDGSRFDPDRPLSAQYREILPPGAAVRSLTPAFNIYGTITLLGGALYSAWLLGRRQVAAPRVAGNVLIAAGAFVIAAASTMVRLGIGDVHYAAEAVAAALMFGGFLLATSAAAAASPAEAARA